MWITLRQLAVFTAVADAGSTTAAAGRVALSQSATSAALNELEAVLAARLFDRVGTRLVLNDTGRGLLPQARARRERGGERTGGGGHDGDSGGAKPHCGRPEVICKTNRLRFIYLICR